jgi:DNA-binding MarR family transcriptional regulator
MPRSGDMIDGGATAGTDGTDDGTGTDNETATSCGGVLAGDLGWGLGVTFRAYVAAAHPVLVNLPGGPRGYQVLATAARGAVNSQLALAQHLGVDRTVMTYLLDDLEAAGLIERQADPADRRARRIVATAAGQQRLDELDQRLRDVESDLLAPLDPAAQASFRTHLRVLATGAGRTTPTVAADGSVGAVGDPCQAVDPGPTSDPCGLADEIAGKTPFPL